MVIYLIFSSWADIAYLMFYFFFCRLTWSNHILAWFFTLFLVTSDSTNASFFPDVSLFRSHPLPTYLHFLRQQQSFVCFPFSWFFSKSFQGVYLFSCSLEMFLFLWFFASPRILDSSLFSSWSFLPSFCIHNCSSFSLNSSTSSFQVSFSL